MITRLFLVGVQPFATTAFGVPIPLPTPQGRRAQQLKTRPECWIRGLHEASTQGIEATSANLFRKECLGMQRSPKAMLLRPTNVDLPECDCHLPPMESDGRRSRPVGDKCKSTYLRVDKSDSRGSKNLHQVEIQDAKRCLHKNNLMLTGSGGGREEHK